MQAQARTNEARAPRGSVLSWLDCTMVKPSADITSNDIRLEASQFGIQMYPRTQVVPLS
jgi:hypothetical protein